MVQATTWGVPRSGPATPAVMAERMDDSLDALLSSQASATAPTYAVEGTLWADNSVSGTISVKMYDGADWITIAAIDKSSNTSAPAGETATGAAFRVAADAAAGRTALSLGTAATLTAGTSANNVVQLDGSARLPAVDGSQLTNVGAGTLRAWVNFDGTGTASIRASGNVSSITDNGVGDYTVNFSTALADANYAPVLGLRNDPPVGSGGNAQLVAAATAAPTSSAIRVVSGPPTSGTLSDYSAIYVAVFR
jgi:hypothetical protein